MASPVALMLIPKLQPLMGLADWKPVGILVEEVYAMARGEGGISQRSTDRIRVWGKRWPRVHPSVRAFYEKHAADGAVSPALWHILGGFPRPDGWKAGKVYQLWEEDHGARSGFDLFPSPPPPTTHRGHQR